MVTNLLFEQIHNVDIGDGTFIHDDGKSSVDEIPAIRYRFANFYSTEIDFIQSMLERFPRSLHVAEVLVTGGKSLEQLRDELYAVHQLKHVAKFLRVPLTSEDIRDEHLRPEVAQFLSTLCTTPSITLEDGETELHPLNEIIDRVSLVDESKSLYMMASYRIRVSTASLLKIKDDNISFCETPLAQDSSMACLTANTVRMLGAKYGLDENMVIATNVVEGSNAVGDCYCQCMKHTLIQEDIVADLKAEKETKAKEAPKSANRGKRKKLNVPDEEVSQVGERCACPFDAINEPEAEEEESIYKIPASKTASRKKPKLPKGAIRRY